MERIRSPHRGTVMIFATAMALVAVAAPVAANAAGTSPLTSFLPRPGEMGGFKPGKAQVFRTAPAMRNAAGERPPKSQVRCYEAEGFVEGAMVRIHGQAEPAARGASSAFEFEAPTGARAEMRAELKEELDVKAARTGGLHFLTRKHFGVPGVPGAVVFALVTNKEADKLGIETGIAKGLFIEGNCLVAVGIFRPSSKEVTGPVVSGVQAIYRRTGATCP